MQILKLTELHGAENMIGDNGVEMDTIILGALNGNQEAAQEITAALRQDVASGLDEIEAEMDELKEKSEALARLCDKPMRMRATKEGRVYTASICTPALNYCANSDKPKHTETHVWVKTD